MSEQRRYRTHKVGELRANDEDMEVLLSGWVNSRRDHGGLIFVDLRDVSGLVQLVMQPEDKEMFAVADGLRSEFVVRVEGVVRKRPAEMVNADIETGEVEVVVKGLEVLSESKTPPFEIDRDDEVSEDVRYKYRYLDLRRRKTQEVIKVRTAVMSHIRGFLAERGFFEIQTPILAKSTPEGARDFLVPSRRSAGQFYALPQSPQQYKQMLMVGGLDRYFQFAACFRDEDSRKDRLPEFYQLDMELSFVTQEEILDLTEELFTELIEKFSNKKLLTSPWQRMAFDDAMSTYGIDKPDVRFEMHLKDVSEMAGQSGFQVFAKTVVDGGVVKGLVLEGCGEYSRKQMDELTEMAQGFGAKGLAWMGLKGDGSVSGPIAKFFEESQVKAFAEAMGAKKGDMLIFVADTDKVATDVLGQMRYELGQMLKLVDDSVAAMLWVVDWPMFEWNQGEQRWDPQHHIFTAPRDEYLETLTSDPASVRSWQHDMVMNGLEVGGGSMRIYRPDVQEQVLGLVGIPVEEARAQFGHMIEAFEFGAPPHGGIAPGLDRFLYLLLDAISIRDVHAFPKNGKGQELMTGAPSGVYPEQLRDLGLEVKKR